MPWLGLLLDIFDLASKIIVRELVLQGLSGIEVAIIPGTDPHYTRASKLLVIRSDQHYDISDIILFLSIEPHSRAERRPRGSLWIFVVEKYAQTWFVV